MSKPLPLYIEFVGIAGAGKTTVRDAVVAQLNARSYRIACQGRMGFQVIHGENNTTSHAGRRWNAQGAGGRLLSSLLLQLQQWRISAEALRYGYATGQLAARSRVLRTMPLICQRIQNARATVDAGYGDLIIFDQGVVHSLRKIAIPGSAVAEERMASMLKVVAQGISPARVVFVLFDIDVDTVVRRIRQRPVALGRYDRLSPEEARRELEQQAPCSEYVIEMFSKIHDVEGVLRVDAERAPAALADEITSYILGRLHSNGAEGAETESEGAAPPRGAGRGADGPRAGERRAGGAVPSRPPGGSAPRAEP